MTFSVRKYVAADRLQWNTFLSGCKNNHFMFHRDFMEYHADRFEDFSLLIVDDKNKIVSILPGNIEQHIFYSHQGLTFGGFLVDKNIHASEFIEIFELVKVFLKQQNIEKIIYKPIPNIYHQYPAQEDLYALFRSNAQLNRRDISSSILIHNAYKYSRAKRWGINKARREGVLCLEIQKPSEVWGVIREVLSEFHDANPVHNEQEIDYLKEKFPKNIKVYAAQHQGNNIAACVTFETEEVVHTQYLASSKLGRDLHALDLLIDHVILQCSTYAKILDFGISCENNGHYLNNGLINQKESFGARSIVYDLYSVDLTVIE
ncbi:GNAT family N-acetyltransferase [Acinetobacter larvae]|uniref:GNAT family N-acetyltransferase n=1 Tax=Acinetobacter larvae TaxID=1789224 RepID=A0A1B2LVP4_9GAMM|nr:GNAT family N-acetyltransferase [Acinetobacter larvae]AOA56989.1 GNAT family N-acetyltransferase [Acinetobacter larvae]